MDIGIFDDLKKMYVIKILIETGSLNKTARIQKVSASAISQTIKSLEAKIGSPLVIRKDDTWSATEKGLQMLNQASPIFSSMDLVFEKEQKSTTLQLASLAVGTYESIALQLVPALSEAIRQDFPDVKMSYRVGRTADLLKKLRSGELCSAIIPETDTPTDFLQFEIFSDRLGLFHASKYKDVKIEDPRWVHGMISASTDGLPRYFQNFLKQLPDFKPHFICDSFEVLRKLAEDNQALVVLPRLVARKSGTLLTEVPLDHLPHGGEHKIHLTTMKDCDKREYAYLTEILKKVYSTAHS